MSTEAEVYYIDNTTTIEILNLYDNLKKEFVSDAVVQATLVDINNNEVTGVNWPILMLPIPKKNYSYRGVVEFVENLTLNIRYTLVLDVFQDNDVACYRLPVILRGRRQGFVGAT